MIQLNFVLLLCSTRTHKMSKCWGAAPRSGRKWSKWTCWISKTSKFRAESGALSMRATMWDVVGVGLWGFPSLLGLLCKPEMPNKTKERAWEFLILMVWVMGGRSVLAPVFSCRADMRILHWSRARDQVARRIGYFLLLLDSKSFWFVNFELFQRSWYYVSTYIADLLLSYDL